VELPSVECDVYPFRMCRFEHIAEGPRDIQRLGAAGPQVSPNAGSERIDSGVLFAAPVVSQGTSLVHVAESGALGSGGA
jgi:hypothetical protein